VATEARPDLSYFVEWGGRPWIDLVTLGLDGYLGGHLDGLRVLDIGARSGRMSSLLALRGADVVGIDVDDTFVPGAEAEARRWGVGDRVRFVVDDGQLGSVEDASIDVAFTKSVLVMISDLDAYLGTLAVKLRPGGRFVFIENGRGSIAMRTARRLRHPTWDLDRFAYFTEERLAMVGRALTVARVDACTVPPIYLICGRAKDSAAE
jgi:SAM-dependent methyltransferase